MNQRLRDYVQDRLAATIADGEGRAIPVSHEAIYQSLYIQGHGALRRELTACLRTGRALRVPWPGPDGEASSSSAPRS
jgi:IS30 family transposase